MIKEEEEFEEALTQESDSESFVIPCLMGSDTIKEALCDLGSSINLIPLSLAKNLEGVEVEDSSTIETLVDGSKVQALGRDENLLLRFGKLWYINEFEVMDISEDDEGQFVLRIQFLAT